MHVGIIGLGNIGGHVAANLVADGHEVTVFDTDEVRSKPLVEAGATAAPGPAEVAKASEITLLSLPTPEVVDAVADAWLKGASKGDLLVDLSTNSPEAVRKLGERISAAGCELLDAPLPGGAPGAQARMLVFMVGGDRKAFERCEPVLEKLSRAIFHLGPLGLGNTAKLVNSCVAFTTSCASLEALALGAKAGLDLRALVELVRTAGAGNFYIDRAVEAIGIRGAPTEFALELAAKDAGLILDLARENGVPMPLASGAAQTLVTAVGAGLGGADWTELPAVIERLAELEFRLAAPRAG